LSAHARPFAHYLHVDGLMALAVRIRAGETGQNAAWIEAQHHAVVKPRGLFQEITDAAATQLAALFRFGGASGKSAPVSKLETLVHYMYEIAAVIGDAGLQLVRHRRGRNVIAPPDFHRIEFQDPRGAIDQHFDQESRLRPSSSAIGR